MRSIPFRAVAGFMLVLHLQACTTWEPESLSPRQVIVGQQPKLVRATKHDGARVVVARPSIAGDSILGSVELCVPSELRFGSEVCRSTVRPLISLDDVRLVEVRRPDTVKSLLAVIVGVGAFFGLMALILCGSGECGLGGGHWPTGSR